MNGGPSHPALAKRKEHDDDYSKEFIIYFFKTIKISPVVGDINTPTALKSLFDDKIGDILGY